MEWAEKGFESVVIVGMYPNGNWNYIGSATLDGMTMLGILETAKMHCFTSWEGK